MSKLATNLHCDNCESGIVILTVTNTKLGKTISMSADVKPCNVCKKYFGLKGVRSLKAVSNENN